MGADQRRAAVRAVSVPGGVGHCLLLLAPGEPVRRDVREDRSRRRNGRALMKTHGKIPVAALTLGATTLLAATPAFAQAVAPQWRYLTFGVFAAIIGLTMYVTYLAAK